MIYFIPTPIGNLEDISQRSLALLARVQNIFCEDSRVTKKLLLLLAEKNSLEINQKKFIPFHTHNEHEVLSSLDIENLQTNEYIFVSDAGMPCISDPGALMVKFCQENGVDYEILPGANALLSAYSASGFLESEFSFFGFLPHKGNDRAKKLQDVVNSSKNAIIYESPHRILTLLSELFKLIPTREIFAVKELTKKHETKFFGTVEKVKQQIENFNQKGEWVVVLKANENPKTFGNISEDDINSLSIKPKQKAKLLAKITGKTVQECYENLLNDEK